MWSSVECGGIGGDSVPAPCARGKHSATLLGGYVYVLGGRGAGGSLPLRDFWRYCLGEYLLSVLSKKPAPSKCGKHSAKLLERLLSLWDF